MPSNQPISNSPGLVQLDPWPLTRERVSHIFDGLKEFGGLAYRSKTLDLRSTLGTRGKMVKAVSQFQVSW